MTDFSHLASLSPTSKARARCEAYHLAATMIARLYVKADTQSAIDLLDKALDDLQEAVAATMTDAKAAQRATARAFERVRLACPAMPRPSLAQMVTVARY